MTDIIALIGEATDDEVDRADMIATQARERRSKTIGCWCADDPRTRACPRCGDYETGVFDGLLASIVAARIGVEITAREAAS